MIVDVAGVVSSALERVKLSRDRWASWEIKRLHNAVGAHRLTVHQVSVCIEIENHLLQNAKRLPTNHLGRWIFFHWISLHRSQLMHLVRLLGRAFTSSIWWSNEWLPTWPASQGATSHRTPASGFRDHSLTLRSMLVACARPKRKLQRSTKTQN